MKNVIQGESFKCPGFVTTISRARKIFFYAVFCYVLFRPPRFVFDKNLKKNFFSKFSIFCLGPPLWSKIENFRIFYFLLKTCFLPFSGSENTILMLKKMQKRIKKIEKRPKNSVFRPKTLL